MTFRHCKTISTTLKSVVLLISACSTAHPEPSHAETQVPGYQQSQSRNVSVGRSTGVTLMGMGVELDPHFLSQNVTRPDNSRAGDWEQIVVPRVLDMQVERFRVMLLPHWWEPYNDNDDPAVADMTRFTFESVEMQSLCKVLDLAQQTGAEVTLVLWGCPISCDQVDEKIGYIGRHFLCTPGATNWVTKPASNEEFAENFSVVVKYLIEQKGYTCIKELTPFNEPDGNVCELENYIPLAKVLDQRLRRDGLRDKLRLNLSDNTDTRLFFLEGCAAELQQQADLFNSHTYIFGYETPNKTVVAWEKANVAAAKVAGKQHLVGEFGSNQCVGATRQRDINKYERGVLMTRHVLNFLNAGAAGISYWSLIDQYYNRNAAYSEMQQLGLWHYVRSAYAQDPDAHEVITKDYQVRPQYYAYSLLTRFIRKGSEVYPLTLSDNFVAGAAIRDKEGRWTYIFANGSNDDISFNLKNKLHGGMANCNAYRYIRGMLPDDGSQIVPSLELRASDKGAFNVCVPSQSVLVLTQR